MESFSSSWNPFYLSLSFIWWVMPSSFNGKCTLYYYYFHQLQCFSSFRVTLQILYDHISTKPTLDWLFFRIKELLIKGIFQFLCIPFYYCSNIYIYIYIFKFLFAFLLNFINPNKRIMVTQKGKSKTMECEHNTNTNPIHICFVLFLIKFINFFTFSSPPLCCML